ncbi:MAG: hypothetical protein HYY93_07575 [Planctomycetes bacterium]|nr:hypothetical protein [Planctomycetota bacterium]
MIDLIQTSPATARERLLRAYACRLIPYVCAGDQALEDRGYLTLRGLVLGDADAFARIAALAALTGLSVAGSDELNPPYFAASLASHPSPADVLSGHSFRHRASQDPSLPEDLCTLLRSDAPDAVRSTALDAIEVMTTTSSLRQAYLAPLRMMLTGASSSAALPERALTLLLGFPADLSLPVVEELASRPGPLAPLALGTLASNGELRERHLPLIRAYALQSRSDPVFQGEGSLYYERAKHLAFQALASVAEKDKTPDGPSGIEAGLRRTADWTTVEAASNAAAKVRSKALVPALKSILNLDPPYEVQDSVCAALELSDPTYMGPKSLGLEMTRLNDKLAEMQPDDPARADLLVHAEALRRQFEDECKRRPMPTSQ